jgi:hypothetical protein
MGVVTSFKNSLEIECILPPVLEDHSEGYDEAKDEGSTFGRV